MNIECAKEKIQKALSVVQRSVSKNPTLPILSCVLIEAKSNSVILKTTNLDVAVEVSFPAKVIKEGKLAIKGETLFGFISNVQDGRQITIESVEGNIVVKTKEGEAVIKCVPNDDFPETPKVSGAVSVLIDSGNLSNGIRSVFYSASISHVKPELSSVVVYGEGKNLIFVATDSFRLAEKKIQVDLSKEIPKTIIPIKNAIELARISDDFEKENLKLSFSKNQIAVEGKGFYFVSRVVDGSFPDYRQIIPKEWKAEAVVLKEDLSRAIRTATVFSDSFYQTTFSIISDKKKVELKSKNNDIGEGEISIPAAISGESMSISFNHKYLSDCLASIYSDSISVSFSGPNKPSLIRGVSDQSFIYIVMPMNR